METDDTRRADTEGDMPTSYTGSIDKQITYRE